MTRILLTMVVPLILPSLSYLIWRAATGRALVTQGVAAMPWPWLLGIGIVLTAMTLFVVSVRYGNSPNGTYVPPHIVGGAVVPGEVVPKLR